MYNNNKVAYLSNCTKTAKGYVRNEVRDTQLHFTGKCC